MKVYLEERLKRHIIDGERIGLEEQLELARQQYPFISSNPSMVKVVESCSAPGNSCHLYCNQLKL